VPHYTNVPPYQNAALVRRRDRSDAVSGRDTRPCAGRLACRDERRRKIGCQSCLGWGINARGYGRYAPRSKRGRNLGRYKRHGAAGEVLIRGRNDCCGADCGRSRRGAFRAAIRPPATFTVAIRNDRFTSTPAVCRVEQAANDVRRTGWTTRVRQVSTAMTETDADCLRLLPNRRLGSFHRFRDLDHRGPRFRMGFELPQILFSPWFADSGSLFRHGLHSSL
jgi:hypothetical protein